MEFSSGVSFLCALLLGAGTALADMSGGVVRIGVLSDQSGPYQDIMGPGSVMAARMAVEDFGGNVGGARVEVIAADHQNKPDVGSNTARQWLDTQGVDVIVELANSAVALSVVEIVKARNRVALVSGATTNRLTGDACSANHAHWAFDNYASANSTVRAILGEGMDSWFFLTADYAFGHDMENQAGAILKANGGRVLGTARHPLGETDYSSHLLQAQASRAKVVGFANAATDFINGVKQAVEFGLPQRGQKIAGLNVYLSDIDAIGLGTAQGLLLSTPFYWDLNDGTRQFAARFAARANGRKPSVFQAALYSAVLHYLKAVASLGDDRDGRAVMAKMKEIPADDPIFGQGSVRIDGRKVHPMYLFQVKTPQESTARWDYYKLVRTVPAAEAWKAPDPACSLVQRQ